MSGEENKYTEPFDFESVMLSKGWEELTEEERGEVMFSGMDAQEYEQMRIVLGAIKASSDTAAEIKNPPKQKEMLMEAFKTQHAGRGGKGSSYRIIRSFRGKGWIPMAAAAILLLVVTSILWIQLKKNPDSLIAPPVELAQQTDNLPPPETIPNSLESIDKTVQPSTPSNQVPDQKEQKNLATKELKPATNPETSPFEIVIEDATAGNRADEFVATSPNLYNQQDTLTSSLFFDNTALMTDNFVTAFAETTTITSSRKEIVSQRPSMPQKSVSNKKGKVPLSKPVSSDEALIGFLYTCF